MKRDASTLTAARRPAPPGPGLPEACGWAAGYQFAQLVSLSLFLGLLLLFAFDGLPPHRQAVTDLILETRLDTSFLLTGVSSLAAVLLVIPAVRWRLGQAARQHLNVRRIGRGQLVLVCGAVLPLAIVSDGVYQTGLAAWDVFRETAGVPEVFDRLNGLEAIRAQLVGTPLPILIVALALGPALGEEIVYRGLVGRGLTARWGVTGGVLLTSLLFAAAHIFPPHALATLPLAIFLHFVYLTTRSLWAPILLHFLNNALGVVLMRYSTGPHLPASPLVVTFAAAYVLILAALLWRVRPEELSFSTDRPRLLDRDCFRGRFPRWALTLGAAAFPFVAAAGILSFTCAFLWQSLRAGV